MRLFTANSIKKYAIPIAIVVGSLPSVSIAQTSNVSVINEINEIATGDQRILENVSSNVKFAGRTVLLENFSGVAGFASDVAYLAVVSGKASLDSETVTKGYMLLLPPYGGDVTVERFDAARLRDEWSSNAKLVSAQMATQIGKLAKHQKRGIFLGRLVRTRFNVATLGSTKLEQTRRETLGGGVIQKIRFGSNLQDGSIERDIVARFLAALVSKDEETVAQLLDPQPFGYDGLGGDGGSARLLMARALINERDWSAFAQSTPEKSSETRWTVDATDARAVIQLRRTTDFAFVQALQVGQ